MFRSLPHHELPGAKFRRARWWAGASGVGSGRVAGPHGGVELHVLRFVLSKEIELSLKFFLAGAVSVFIATASPNKASLGATNGLAQLSVAIMRAIGPALVSSIYSLSIDEDHHYMNGGLVYYMTVTVSLGAIWVGSLLPKNPWKDKN